MRKHPILPYIPYGIAIVLFAIAAMYDYEIDAYLYDPNNLYTIFFERCILIPITLLVPLAFYARYKIKNSALSFLCYGISCIYVCFDFAHFWMDVLENAIPILVVSLMFFLIFTWLLSHITLSFWKQYEPYLHYVLVVFLSSMICMVVLKYTWGRVRFREMLGDVSKFTPWYLPQGYTSHVSFPSGHTTAISVILCSLDAHSVKHTHPPFWWHYVIVFGLIISMMFARMIIGAHFLSDVTMGFCITYTVFLIMRRRIHGGKI